MALRVIAGAALLAVFALPALAGHQAEPNAMEMDANVAPDPENMTDPGIDYNAMDTNMNEMGLDTDMSDQTYHRYYLIGLTGEGAASTAIFIDTRSVRPSGALIRATEIVWDNHQKPDSPAGTRRSEQLVEVDCDGNLIRTVSGRSVSRGGRLLGTDAPASPPWDPVAPNSIGSESFRFLCRSERDFRAVDNVAAIAYEILPREAGAPPPSAAHRAAPRRRGR